MMLIYLGAEVGSNRTLLESMNVRAMGVSYARMVKRGMPKTKSWLVSERFDSNVRVVAFPGVSETKNMSTGELEAFAADYQEWVIENVDRLDGFVEFDPPQLGPDWIRQQRGFWVDAGDKFWPVWNPDLGYQELLRMSLDYSDIAITGAAIESQVGLAGQARAVTATQGTNWHGLAIASPDNLRQVPLVTASTLSWASPMMRGETIVWDGTALKRYPKKMKDQARPRYKNIIEQAGLDYAAILADDAKEVTRLAVWSYQRLEEHMTKKERPFQVIDGDGQPVSDVDNSVELDPEIAGMLFGEVDNRPTEERQPQSRVPAPRMASERAFLPVLGVDSKTVVETLDDGREVLREVPILSSTATSLRQCNTCFVAANCPAFKADSECAFSLPVEVKTKDQLKALLNAIIEMQGARVAFARFSEELNGGYPDPNVSQEIDRLFKIVEQLKKLEDNKEFVRMTFERQGGAGVLSSIFGDRVQVLQELDGGGLSEEQGTRIIQQSLED
jgi:hypothetical protein